MYIHIIGVIYNNVKIVVSVSVDEDKYTLTDIIDIIYPPLITSDHDDGINKSRDESKKSENEALHGIRNGCTVGKE